MEELYAQALFKPSDPIADTLRKNASSRAAADILPVATTRFKISITSSFESLEKLPTPFYLPWRPAFTALVAACFPALRKRECSISSGGKRT